MKGPVDQGIGIDQNQNFIFLGHKINEKSKCKNQESK
jgi:hypothetical protein